MNKIEHASQLHACPHEECAEPVKVPIDDEVTAVKQLSLAWASAFGLLTSSDVEKVIRLAKAYAARYGHPAQPAASVEPRPDGYVYFYNWYSKDAPHENEVSNFDMARHAWLAGMRFADLFPQAPVAGQPAANVEHRPLQPACPDELDKDLIDFKWREINRADDSWTPSPHVVLAQWAYGKGLHAQFKEPK